MSDAKSVFTSPDVRHIEAQCKEARRIASEAIQAARDAKVAYEIAQEAAIAACEERDRMLADLASARRRRLTRSLEGGAS